MSQQNVFGDILERKKVFLHSKIRKSKKLKNWHFSKGVSLWFRSKIGNFSMFLLFFVKIRQESVFKDILGRKKTFFRL